MERLILSEDEIERICERLGKEIDEDLEQLDDSVPVVMGVMNGGMPFFYELVKHITHPILLDTIKVNSYRGTESSNEVTVDKEPDFDLRDRDVVLVEDIIDTGVTMNFLKESINSHYHPRSLKICVLIKRNAIEMKYDVAPDFIGLCTDEQKYIVGFGFDYYGLCRNTPYIFVPSTKDIKEWNEYLGHNEKKK